MSSESISSRSDNCNPERCLQQSIEGSVASSIMEYPSSVELESASEPTECKIGRSTSGPVDLDLSFSESFASEPVDPVTSFPESHDDMSCIANTTNRDGGIQSLVISGAIKQASSSARLLSKASSNQICASLHKDESSGSKVGQKRGKSSLPTSIVRSTYRDSVIQDNTAPSVIEEASVDAQRSYTSSKQTVADSKSNIFGNKFLVVSDDSANGDAVTNITQSSNGSPQGTSDSPKSVIDFGSQAGFISWKEAQSKGTSPSRISNTSIAILSKSTNNSNILASTPTATTQPIHTVLSELSWDSMLEVDWGLVNVVPDVQPAEPMYADCSASGALSTGDPEKSTPLRNGEAEVSAWCNEVESMVSEGIRKSHEASKSNENVSVTLTGNENGFTKELARSIKNELEKLQISTSEIVIEISPAVSKHIDSIDSARVTVVSSGRTPPYEKARSEAAGPEEVRFSVYTPRKLSSVDGASMNRYE